MQVHLIKQLNYSHLQQHRRLGFEYLYGSDPQYEFTNTDPVTGKITALNQNRAGIGMWYDY